MSTVRVDIHGELYECGPVIRHDGKDSGQCLVYHPRSSTSFVVNISDAELLAATHVAEARERAVRRTIERLEAAKESGTIDGKKQGETLGVAFPCS